MLRHRIISGIIAGGAALLGLFFLPQLFLWIFIVIWSALGQLEFYAMMDKAKIPVFRVVGIICGTLLISTTFHTLSADPEQAMDNIKWENLVMVASFIVIFIRLFPQKNNTRQIETVGGTLLGIFYIPFLLNFFVRLAFTWTGTDFTGWMNPTGRGLILFLLLTVKFTDIGAYTAGRLLGRHKACPRISPGKTWEGFVGGLITAATVGLLFYRLSGGAFGTIRFTLTDAIIMGILLGIAGIIGDLFESLLKRSAGVKDASGIAPGLGGILDMIDSLLFGAPVLYAYVALVLT